MTLRETQVTLALEASDTAKPQDASEGQRKPKHWLFTPERARELQKASQIARERNEAARQEALRKEAAESLPEPKDPYIRERLSGVREMIKLLDIEAKHEITTGSDCLQCPSCKASIALNRPSSKRLKELGDSAKAYSETERQLSGRPLPGSLRPKAERSPRQSANVQPLD